MRKLADYAFMLRDWKLALSCYDLLRTDFANDKAWRYHAGAHVRKPTIPHFHIKPYFTPFILKFSNNMR